MIGRLNHVAIVVPDLAAAGATYRDTLGARVADPVDLPDHGVTAQFVELPNTRIELLQPLGSDSPIAGFLDRTRPAAFITFVLRSTTSSPRGIPSSPKAPGCWMAGSRAPVPTANRSFFCIRKISPAP